MIIDFDWGWMATYHVQFDGGMLTVDLVNRLAPEPALCFLIRFPYMECLLLKSKEADQFAWKGNRRMNAAECRELGEQIEGQTGIILPTHNYHDPFENSGDLEIATHIFPLGPLKVERAKAPFRQDFYYKVHFKDKIPKLHRMLDEEGNPILNKKPFLCEIKYTEELQREWEFYELKFKAANSYACANWFQFKVYTEEDIRTDD